MVLGGSVNFAREGNCNAAMRRAANAERGKLFGTIFNWGILPLLRARKQLPSGQSPPQLQAPERIVTVGRGSTIVELTGTAMEEKVKAPGQLFDVGGRRLHALIAGEDKGKLPI